MAGSSSCVEGSEDAFGPVRSLPAVNKQTGHLRNVFWVFQLHKPRVAAVAFWKSWKNIACYCGSYTIVLSTQVFLLLSHLSTHALFLLLLHSLCSIFSNLVDFSAHEVFLLLLHRGSFYTHMRCSCPLLCYNFNQILFPICQRNWQIGCYKKLTITVDSSPAVKCWHVEAATLWEKHLPQAHHEVFPAIFAQVWFGSPEN